MNLTTECIFEEGTALQAACDTGWESTVEILLDVKADINIPDRYGDNTLIIATGKGWYVSGRVRFRTVRLRTN